ncbi:MAG: glutathione S-transferase C-terminal domain-containing protein, partial [Proteobacteria bacterium]|nr:glutathione S-transferase C-terminal domain-containing protein [Pseudomonadota bacterium]
MGLLIDGVWHDRGYDASSTGGRFLRRDAQFRNWVTPDGAPGPSGAGGFEAEPGRYHLYVSYACPWAHRTLIFRKLKRLEDAISVSVVHWHMGDEGWEFRDGPGCTPDTANGASHLREVYLKAKPDYSGRVTVPVLWDNKRATIVSNESSEIIRMFNSAFDGLEDSEGGTTVDFYPDDLRADIDAINAKVYAAVNNGVYRCGFARSQEAYDTAVRELFDALDELEARLDRSRYLVGERPTEADWRLLPTLVRFDVAYFTAFKCNLRRL